MTKTEDRKDVKLIVLYISTKDYDTLNDMDGSVSSHVRKSINSYIEAKRKRKK